MIACMSSSEHPLYWKKVFAQSYVGLNELKPKLPDSHTMLDQYQVIDGLFPVQVSRHLLEKFPVGHPVLKQYLPDIEELTNPPEYARDPVGDQQATLAGGLIKKYQHRALLITNSTCPIHCRYCFRKDYPYSQQTPQRHRFNTALKLIHEDPSLNEIILSGGDPLSLDDDLLDDLIKSIEKIPHIKTLRLHTKFPSIYPQRITQSLLNTLANCRLKKVCVLHINHSDELDDEFTQAAEKIKSCGVTLLNQSVLLKAVNDDVDTLIQLSHQLFASGVLPYYLHLLDKARGTHHFYVPKIQAENLLEKMKQQLPGYLVPKLAQEIAGHSSKHY